MYHSMKTRSDRVRPASLFVPALVLAGATAAFALQEKDYSRMPPAHSEVEARLKNVPADLGDAIANAELILGGVAKSARIVLDRNSPMIEVTVYSTDMAHVAEVDGATGKVNEVRDQPRFPGELPQGEMIETASGLKYFEIVEGTGHSPADATSRVRVHYTGWLVDGTKFESSVDRGAPVEFSLGSHLKGWTEGIGSMREGGKRKLIIPFDLAYGEAGRPGSIPPRATVIFDVELIEVLGE